MRYCVGGVKAYVMVKKGAVSIIDLELEVDVWFGMHLEIYYKSYIPFVCERN